MKRKVISDNHIVTSNHLAAALSYDNIAWFDGLSTKAFYTESFTFGIAAVLGRTSGLCM
jgi:hypothetical protein